MCVCTCVYVCREREREKEREREIEEGAARAGAGAGGGGIDDFNSFVIQTIVSISFGGAGTEEGAPILYFWAAASF